VLDAVGAVDAPVAGSGEALEPPLLAVLFEVVFVVVLDEFDCVDEPPPPHAARNARADGMAYRKVRVDLMGRGGYTRFTRSRWRVPFASTRVVCASPRVRSAPNGQRP
jgi:hypothetical protein